MSIQKEIAAWADEAFGPAPDMARIAARANEEMAELLRTVTTTADGRDIAYEAADVVIVLYRLCDVLGADLDYVIKKKLDINRHRKWSRDGTGHGYHHVKNGSS